MSNATRTTGSLTPPPSPSHSSRSPLLSGTETLVHVLAETKEEANSPRSQGSEHGFVFPPELMGGEGQPKRSSGSFRTEEEKANILPSVMRDNRRIVITNRILGFTSFILTGMFAYFGIDFLRNECYNNGKSEEGFDCNYNSNPGIKDIVGFSISLVATCIICCFIARRDSREDLNRQEPEE